MNDCEYFEQLCSNSIDGTLTDDERQALEKHVAECPSCARLLGELSQMRALFMAEVDVPTLLHEQIMERVEQEVRMTVVQPEKRTRHVPVFTMAAAAAVVMMVVLSGGFSQFFGGKSGAAPSAGSPVTADAADAPLEQLAPKAGEPSATYGVQTEQAPVLETQTAPALDAATQSAQDKQLRIVAHTADEATITLPTEIEGMSVAYCYVATGAGELPELDSTPLIVNGNESYFALENNMNIIEKTLDNIEKAGFTVAAHEDIALVSDPEAETWLLVVRKQ